MPETNDNQIESILTRYHPAGPSDELKTRIFTPKPQRRLRPYLAAAVILVLIGLALTFRPWRTSPTPTMTPAQIQAAVERAGYAAQLLASADLLAQQPGGELYAKQSYQDIIRHYPDLDIAAQAHSRLASLNERNTP